MEFLTRLAHEYNHSFKIVNKTLVFTTMQSLEECSPVAVIDLAEVKAIRLRDRIQQAVAKVEVNGFDNQKKSAIKSTKATNADTLKIVTRGESQAQMDARADAALSQESDVQQAGNITLIGNPKLVAGNTIWLTNMGLFSGKYLIKSARHSMSKMQGYVTKLEIRMLEYNEIGANEKTGNA